MAVRPTAITGLLVCSVLLTIWLGAQAQTIDELISAAANTTWLENLHREDGSVMVDLDMRLSAKQWKEIESCKRDAKNGRVKRAAIKSPSFRWPNNIIPYAWGPGFTSEEKSEIISAMNDFMEFTCLRMTERTTEENYMYIISGPGCWSHVGMQGGMQELSLGHGCKTRSMAVHQIAHAVGLFHEHRRPDRDDWVNVLWENIKPGKEVHFYMLPENYVNLHNIYYDYLSIMHYGQYAHSKSTGYKTLSPDDPYYQLRTGYATTLSFRDVALINKMLGCAEKCNISAADCGDAESYVGPDCRCYCRGFPVRRCDGSEEGGSCVDDGEHCKYWVSIGECEKNPSYMSRNCKRSCGVCEMPPTVFTQQPQVGSVEMKDNTKVLMCGANANPSPVYRWIKDGVFISETKTEKIFRFQHIQEKDAGEYQCIASNAYGALLSNKVNITVAYMVPFPNTASQDQRVDQGHACVINLPAIRSYPPPTIQWFDLGTQASDPSNPIPQEAQDYQVTQSHQLVILETTMQNNNTRFKARATNSYTSQTSDSQLFVLRVQNVGNLVSEIPPEIVIPPKDTVVSTKSDTAAVFECVANARSLNYLRINWYRKTSNTERTIITPSSSKYILSLHRRRLTIKNPMTSDSGTYQCEASYDRQGASFSPVTAEAELIVPVAPTFATSPSSDLRVGRGSSVELSCSAVGVPQPDIVWYKNGVTVDSLNDDRIDVQTEGTLKIKRSQPSDSGVYQCFASNPAGEINSAAWVQISLFGSCVDDGEQCKYWASIGECEKNPSYMSRNCKSSCGMCESCLNGHVDCNLWASTGECENNPKYMGTYCQRACGFCNITACMNDHVDCEYWASTGECENNPDYMLKHCRKSCQVCVTNDTEDQA